MDNLHQSVTRISNFQAPLNLKICTKPTGGLSRLRLGAKLKEARDANKHYRITCIVRENSCLTYSGLISRDSQRE